MHRSFGATIGDLTRALVASWASASTCRCSYSCGGTSQWLVIATLFVVVVVAVALSGGPRIGLAILACLRGRCGRHGPLPPSTLVHRAEEFYDLLDAVRGKLLQRLLIPHTLEKCNH
jgi:hypothetical protein